MAEGLLRPAHRSDDDRQRPSTPRLRPSAPVLAAVSAALALPLLFRIDVGFAPADVPGRRVLALGVAAVLVGCHLLPGAWPRRLAGLAAVTGLAALGLQSVALTLLLSVLLVEVSLPRLHAPERGSGPSTSTDAALGLTLVSAMVALGERPVTPVPGAVLQVAAIGFVLASPAGLGRLGRAATGAARALRERRAAAMGTPATTGTDRTVASTAPALRYRVVTGLAVLLVLALPTFLRQPSSGDLLADPARQVVAGSLALILTAAFMANRRTVRWVTYGSSVALLELVGWRTVAVPLALSLAIVEAARPAIGGAAPTSCRGRPGGLAAAGAMAGLAVVFGVVGRTISLPVQVALMALAAAVLWVRPDVLTKVAGLVRTVSVAVAAGILKILTALVWVFFVLVPWSFERVAGWDPTFVRRPPGTRLVPRHVQWTDGRRSWIPTTSLLRTRRAGRALARLAGAGLAVLVLGYLVVTKAGVPIYWRDRVPAMAPAAMAGSPWWAEAISPEMAAFERGRAGAFGGPRLADVRSGTTNVVDGRRVTWRPPVTPVVRVWFFGGSTAFGVGQRDDHTIPSELAKAAWKAGIPVEVTNFGVHGDVHWMEANRLQEALASGLAPPDVVVFYDGWNDFQSHVGADGSSADPFFRGTLDPLLAGRRLQGSWFSDLFFPDTVITPPEEGEPVTREQALDRAVVQYRSAAEDTLTLARARGRPTFLFLQPTLATRDRPVEGEQATTAETKAEAEAFRRARPDGVIDLTAVFDPIRSPVYIDEGHTNERGARVVAGEIFRNIEPALRSAADR